MDLIDKLAQVATRELRMNLDERQVQISAAEQELKELGRSKRKRKESAKGKVVAVYFSAVELQRLERRADQGGMAFSALAHEATIKYLDRLDELDGAPAILIPSGQKEEISPELTEQSQKRLDDVAKLIEDYRQVTAKEPEANDRRGDV